MGDVYRAASISEIQAALAGKPSVDIYVRIEHVDHYLAFVRKDQILSAEKLDNLRRLSASSLFVRETEEIFQGAFGEATPEPDALAQLDARNSFRKEVLGVEAASVINDCYKKALDPSASSEAIGQKLISMSESMLEALVPESEDLKKSIVKNLVNVDIMHHAAGITTTTMLVALANEFTSRTALRQISQACILMDISLSELEPSLLEQYYRDRKELPSHAQEIVKQHPVRSHQLLTRYPEVSDSIGQLVLLHHELHNGKGYHRGIRTLNVLPMARVLDLGVDLYEMIKASEYNNSNRSLRQILQDLREPNVEAHNRRHTLVLVENVIKYLKVS